MDRILTDFWPVASRGGLKNAAFRPVFRGFFALSGNRAARRKNLEKIVGNALSGGLRSSKTGDFQSRQIVFRLIAVLQGAQLGVGSPQCLYRNTTGGNAVKEKCGP